MSRPVVAHIRPFALAANLARVRQFCPQTKVWAVIKANAYGHGIAEIFSGLVTADGLALLELHELELVRKLGWTRPVLLLEGLFAQEELSAAAHLDASLVVHHAQQVKWLQQYQGQHRFAVYLKLNSGMNRLGLEPAEFRQHWQTLSSLACVESLTAMTHFADAESSGIERPLNLFKQIADPLTRRLSLANSATILAHPKQAACGWVRAGIMLYGSSPLAPAQSARDLQLQATMQLTSELIAVRDIAAHATVGYGNQFVAKQAMRIGVVACGYADGYPRLAPSGTPIAVNGVMTQTIGRVSMDMITVDLSPCPTATIGAQVELWGDRVAIDEVAAKAGTLGYELMCALAPRVKKLTSWLRDESST